MDTMQVISITNTTYNINKLGIKGRDYVGVAMEILDKERYFNEATLHLFNYISEVIIQSLYSYIKKYIAIKMLL